MSTISLLFYTEWSPCYLKTALVLGHLKTEYLKVRRLQTYNAKILNWEVTEVTSDSFWTQHCFEKRKNEGNILECWWKLRHDQRLRLSKFVFVCVGLILCRQKWAWFPSFNAMWHIFPMLGRQPPQIEGSLGCHTLNKYNIILLPHPFTKNLAKYPSLQTWHFLIEFRWIRESNLARKGGNPYSTIVLPQSL